jgi:hypothetical protein
MSVTTTAGPPLNNATATARPLVREELERLGADEFVGNLARENRVTAQVELSRRRYLREFSFATSTQKIDGLYEDSKK